MSSFGQQACARNQQSTVSLLLVIEGNLAVWISVNNLRRTSQAERCNRSKLSFSLALVPNSESVDSGRKPKLDALAEEKASNSESEKGFKSSSTH